ncbi:hypothetical protein NI389_04815 [Pseudoalteromonas xiamenensis]|uniref:hypothetical protein n=1 Tax=Pseudoalteromonas xiamenensis TaxID=882626 RepID=UPI0027E4F467|nr:hypothetical protein [Pseudoalteromonas xiamenensis]WMN60735.1 hypothetical protein NI389_04815 [Pseudoalteromonas xiamenensis]
MANYQQPPKLAERFLRWSLPEELKESLCSETWPKSFSYFILAINLAQLSGT